jgi:hypothetical protein
MLDNKLHLDRNICEKFYITSYDLRIEHLVHNLSIVFIVVFIIYY